MQIKYSFIIPVYGVEKYIRQCVDSILAQTYRSFEIIIVDDESSDNCGRIADEYAEKYPQFVRAFHQKNTGAGGARNRGISVAKGEFILFVDGDDYIVSNMLEIIEKYKENHDDDLLLFSYKAVRDKDKKKDESCEYFDNYKKISLQEYMIQQPAVWKTVYRISLFEHRDLRFVSKIYYEDLAFSPLFAMYAKSVGMIREPLYYYVSHRGSAMHSRNVERFFEIFTSFNHMLGCFENQNVINEYYAELEWLAVQHVLYFSTKRVLLVDYYPDVIQKFVEYIEDKFPNYRENKYIERGCKEINQEALRLMLNGDFKTVEENYCRKKRKIQGVKDILWKFAKI